MDEKRTAFVAVCMGEAFGIGLCEEDESGYYPQVGFGSFPTYEAASVTAGELNTRLGLDPLVAAQIVCSSMRRQNKRKRTEIKF